MFRLMILYICGKYEDYFEFNKIDRTDSSNEMVQKYKRLSEIFNECMQKGIPDEKARQLFETEVEELRYAIKCKEFVCKVRRMAYLGGLKMIVEFWGGYYTEIDFEEVLQLPEVKTRYPKLENLRNPDVFHHVFHFQYDVYFGKEPERYYVSSDFIWHYGKEIKHQIDETQYEWIKGF